jgi:hypothetical protein
LKQTFVIASVDPQSNEKIEEVCSSFNWGIFSLRKRLAQYHYYNNMPIMTPDPRVSKRFSNEGIVVNNPAEEKI